MGLRTSCIRRCATKCEKRLSVGLVVWLHYNRWEKTIWMNIYESTNLAIRALAHTFQSMTNWCTNWIALAECVDSSLRSNFVSTNLDRCSALSQCRRCTRHWSAIPSSIPAARLHERSPLVCANTIALFAKLPQTIHRNSLEFHCPFAIAWSGRDWGLRGDNFCFRCNARKLQMESLQFQVQRKLVISSNSLLPWMSTRSTGFDNWGIYFV